MKTRLLNYWEILRSNDWFLPTLITGLAIGLSLLTINLDHFVMSEHPERLVWGIPVGRMVSEPCQLTG